MTYIRRALNNSSGIFFIVWSMVASFGAYFSMYAFRKPFNTGTYEGYHLFGLDYKVVLIIVQVFGYMLSKFIGIKIISELKHSQRVKLILGLIFFAETALFFFGLVPYPYNFIFLFFNGLPLGMVWGVVFSFLEGRKFTEILSFGLCVSVIIASGILKTIYLGVQRIFPVSEFWMPFLVGLIFLPLFCLFVWMLSMIPAPSDEDKRLRVNRVPMTNKDKMQVIREYWFGLLCLVIVYAMLTMLRDFRDNFSVEIWTEIDPHWNDAVFSQTEIVIGIIVLAVVGSIATIRNNIRGFWVTYSVMIIGIAISGIGTLLFHLHMLHPFYWMLILGMGMFLAYIPVQVVVFERMFGMFKVRGNAGFFVYICDSIGYMGSVGLLLYKEFFMRSTSWANTMINFSYGLTVLGTILLISSVAFFNRKYSLKGPVSKYLPDISKEELSPEVK